MNSLPAIAAAILFAAVSAVFAGATQDLRVDAEKDSKGNIVYKLVNNGAKNVKATVKHEKNCGGVTSNRKPKALEYWLGPKSSVRLRKVWAESTCRHEFRIVGAEYY